MIQTIIFIVVSSILNRVRGTGSEDKPKFLPNKISVYVLWTIIFAICFNGFAIDPIRIVQSMLILPILWGCFSLGWGKYFPHGNKINPNEKEFIPADFVANMLIGTPSDLWSNTQNANWQTVAMSARFGLTFGLFLFPYLALISHSFLPLIGVLSSWLCGLLYRLAFIKHTDKSLKVAEYLVGAWLGLNISICFW